MYDGCFGLDRRPFASVPQIDQYYPATAIEAARTTLMRTIQRGEGTGLVIGPSGTGKSLLCLVLASQFRRSFQVVILANGRLSTRRALFQAILYELGRPYRGMDEGEARLAVVDYLMSEESDARGMVLLVDEAHTLPLRLLEEIRLLTNLARDGHPLVRAVLFGGPVLEERFAGPKLDSFSQRLSARCYLESLNRTETERYIQTQIEAAGGCGAKLFPKEACQSVFQATGGVPRLINQLCDHALLLAYVAGKESIASATIEEAWSDLQQLPTPWSAEPGTESVPAAGVIEFGSLEEEEETTTETVIAGTTSPELRISPLEEEFEETEAVEPTHQICRIEQMLAEAEEEFQPAGTIKPEVELYFEEPIHPFQEEFEQEEVVSNRYGTTATLARAETPAVVMKSEPPVEALPAAPIAETRSDEAEMIRQRDEDMRSLTYAAEISAGARPDSRFESLREETQEEMIATNVSDLGEVIASEWQSPQEKAGASKNSQQSPRREYRRLFAQLRQG